MWMRLALALILTNAPVHGAREAAPQPPTTIGPATLRSMRRTQLALFVKTYTDRVRSKADLDELFVAPLETRERREIRAELAKLDFLPRITREDDTLSFSLEDVRVPVKFIDYETGQVKIGDVPWTYDRTAPPSWQLRQFERAFKRSLDPTQASSEISLFPRAEAVGLDTAAQAMKAIMLKGPAKTGAGKLFLQGLAKYGSISVVLSGAVNGLFSSGLCFVTYKAGIPDPRDVWGVTCNAFSERLEKQKYSDPKTQIGYTEELSKSLTLAIDKEWQCQGFDPENVDAVYSTSSWIGELEKGAPGTDGKTTSKAKNWKFFRGKIVKGVLKEGEVYSNPENSARLIARITFTEDPLNPYSVKLEHAGETLDVPSNARADMMKVETQSSVRRLILLAKSAQAWVNVCVSAISAKKTYEREDGNAPAAIGIGK